MSDIIEQNLLTTRELCWIVEPARSFSSSEKNTEQRILGKGCSVYRVVCTDSFGLYREDVFGYCIVGMGSGRKCACVGLYGN